MLTWAMAWMMVRLGEVTGYLLVFSIIGDVLLTLLFVSFVNAVIKTVLSIGTALRLMEREGDSNGTGPDST